MAEPLRAPSLGELITLGISRGLDGARVMMPGRIKSYDATKQTAEVEPLLQVYRTAQDGTREAVTLPPISGVPVVFPGAGGFRITFPVAKGDTVALLFADRSLDQWKSKGSARGAVDPLDVRSHHLSDAIAVVGLHDLLTPWTGAATDGMTFGKDGGPQIKVTGSEVRLGAPSASHPVLLGDTFLADLETLIGAIGTAVGGCGTPAGAAAAAVAIATALTAFQTADPTHKSSTVKVAP